LKKKQSEKTEICKKQAQKQATRKSSKKTATPQKTSPNSQENRKVGNTQNTATACHVTTFRSPGRLRHTKPKQN